MDVELCGGYLPERKHAGDAGMDLRAAEDVVVLPGRMVRVSCGIKIAVPNGYVGDVRSRSGLALKHQVVVLNSPGTIDSGYRGDVSAMLINHGQEPFVVHKGDRIAQLVLLPVLLCEPRQVAQLPDSEDGRGIGGHGSTGR